MIAGVRRQGTPMGRSGGEGKTAGAGPIGVRRRRQNPQREKLMVRRKILHLAVILSMVLTMVGVVLPTAVGAAGALITPPSITFAPLQIGSQSAPTAVTITNSDTVATIV